MLVVVGGHSRNIGKTSAVCSFIQAAPHLRWQAFKITQHGHNFCSEDGHPCDCAPGDPAHPFQIDQQMRPDGTDTGRYLAAGAAKSWWVRTAQGQLGHAIVEVKRLLAESDANIVESNSIMQFVRPHLYVVVLDFSVPDMKDSARLYMDRADAFLVHSAAAVPPEQWGPAAGHYLQKKPHFPFEIGQPPPAELAALLRATLH